MLCQIQPWIWRAMGLGDPFWIGNPEPTSSPPFTVLQIFFLIFWCSRKDVLFFSFSILESTIGLMAKLRMYTLKLFWGWNGNFTSSLICCLQWTSMRLSQGFCCLLFHFGAVWRLIIVFYYLFLSLWFNLLFIWI